jgi:O-antigen/teichoic acid export membrane protein
MVPAGLSQALAAAAQPVITRSAQRGDGKDLVYAGTVLRLALLAGALLGLAGLGIGPWLFATLFGARFAMAGELVGPALFCLVPMLAAIGLPAVIMARGHFRAGTLAIVASAVVMTALMLLLVPRFGVYGAIGALFLGHAAAPLIASAYAARQGWHLVPGAVTRPLAALAIAALAWMAMTISGSSRWLAMLAAIAALLASAWRLGVVTREEREFLASAWREQRA